MVGTEPAGTSRGCRSYSRHREVECRRRRIAAGVGDVELFARVQRIVVGGLDDSVEVIVDVDGDAGFTPPSPSSLTPLPLTSLFCALDDHRPCGSSRGIPGAEDRAGRHRRYPFGHRGRRRWWRDRRHRSSDRDERLRSSCCALPLEVASFIRTETSCSPLMPSCRGRGRR